MRWFSSDFHLGHSRILEFEREARPFDDLEEMWQAMLDRFNSRIGPDDELYLNGDTAFNDRWARRLATEMNGRITLGAGNHDPFFQRRSAAKIAKAKRLYLDMGFADVVDGAEMVLADGTPVLVNHFPYYGDHTTDERYNEYRCRDDGMWLICGHIHSMWRTLDRMINVGVDVWDLTPVSEDQIIEIIRAA